MSTVRQAARKPRLAITSGGISAASPARRSIITKPTSSATAATNIAKTRMSVQPQSTAWSSPRRSSTRPPETVAIPA